VQSPQHLWRVIENVFPFLAAPGPGDGAWISGDLVLQMLFYAWPLIAMQVYQAFRGKLEVIGEWPGPVRFVAYFTGAVLFLAFGDFGGDAFFYFQF
jgi:hypothetical protein